jgi:Peptidase family M49
MRRLLCVILLLAPSLLAGQQKPAAKPAPARQPAAQAEHIPDLAELEKMTARFAPTELRVDTSSLSPGDQRALVKLIEAGRVINHIFLDQMWSGNDALRAKLRQDRTPLGRARGHYFRINKSPWSALDGEKAFLPGVPARKPLGANFYPEDMTEQEFEAWLKTLNGPEQEEAKSYFTVIRRQHSDHKLVIFPYSVEYRPDLERAAALLHAAAGLTTNDSLKKFLNARAEAFLSNEYRASDADWMDLDAPLDITIGPYETYADELFGYKASFEAYINLRDDAETAKLGFFGHHLQEIENNLPEDKQYRNTKLGSQSPIRVVNVVSAAGERGVQTAAYNLPNDEVVVNEKGSKRVMLRNIQEAKFNSVLVPISRRVLPPEAQKEVNFQAFFTHTVAHELMHGLGPHQITVTVRKRASTPRLELKEVYGAIEEAKADVTGLFALQFLIDQGQARPGKPLAGLTEKNLYTTYTASAFRSLRFGATEAHARGQAVQINYLLDRGAVVERPDGRFAINLPKMKQAVRDLDHTLLTLEATGDYAGAKRLLDHMGVIRPQIRRVLDKLSDIPVDIEPHYVTAAQLARRSHRSKTPDAGR